MNFDFIEFGGKTQRKFWYGLWYHSTLFTCSEFCDTLKSGVISEGGWVTGTKVVPNFATSPNPVRTRRGGGGSAPKTKVTGNFARRVNPVGGNFMHRGDPKSKLF